MMTLTPPEMKALCASSLFKGYSALALAVFLNEVGAQRKTFANNEVIAFEGEPVKVMGIVLSGSVYLCNAAFPEDGQQRICNILSPGDVGGATMLGSGRRQYPATAVGHGNGSYAAFPLDKIRALQTAGKEVLFFTNLSNFLSEHLLESWQKCAILSCPNIAERVMAYLRIRARKTGSSEVHVPSTEEAFANYLGVNRSALSRVLRKLKSEGKIDYKRNILTLLDFEGQTKQQKQANKE